MVDPQSGTEYVDRNRKAEPDAVNFMYGAPELFHNPAEKRTAGIRVILVLAQGHLEFPDPVAGQGRPLGPRIPRARRSSSRYRCKSDLDKIITVGIIRIRFRDGNSRNKYTKISRITLRKSRKKHSGYGRDGISKRTSVPDWHSVLIFPAFGTVEFDRTELAHQRADLGSPAHM